MLGKIAELPAELGKVGELLADNGYFSEGNVNACAVAGIEPVIAMELQAHHPTLAERFAEDPRRTWKSNAGCSDTREAPDQRGQAALRPAQADA